MNLILFVLFSSLIFGTYSDDSIYCSKEFCASYLSDTACVRLPEACKTQNVTHNGVFLPAPGPCNCCQYCLENLGDGKTCSVGDPSSPTPTTICGPSLICTKKDVGHACTTMDTPCTKGQKLYDEKRSKGTLGHLEVRPTCDRNGLYDPYTCIPGEICYCLSEGGERIFGEIPYSDDVKYKLRCKCSRSYHEAFNIRNRKLHPDEHLRCQSNGDYDALQCLDDQCLCSDTEDGHPTYPEMKFVNITTISATSLPCFNNETHMEAEYYRECEAVYIEELNLIREYQKEGFEVFGYSLPNCQLDGNYAPVQEKKEIKYCSDPQGKLLEDFQIAKTDALASIMNCKCARARRTMTKNEKPECCKNGNYKSIQCRRGLCRCVDENGVQIEKEVEDSDKGSLSCSKATCV